MELINAIVYTALAYLIAEKIEAARMPKDLKIACSYRISLSEDGDFFEKKQFYTDFIEKSNELANKYEFVLKTDITDFYNQIYIHRLQNAIETADASLFEISNEIEHFLLKLNSNSSKGIPVGPGASIIFSEALMIDIDNFISNKGFEFTRYVDDIRVFSHSKKDLDKLLEELTKYLYEQHRLNLSSSKTEIIPIADFLINDLNNPEEQEKQEIHEQLIQIAEVMINEQGYSNSFVDEIEITDLPEDSQARITQDALKNLLSSILNRQTFDLGLVRHILKQARKRRVRVILPLILSNFDFFLPTIREVCLYLNSVVTKKVIDENKEKILEILLKSESMNLSFVRYWVDWLITEKIDYFDKVYFKDYLDSQEFIWHIKQNVILKNTTYINNLKINYDDYNLWSRFEILQGIQLLPLAEKKAFLASKQNGMKKSEEFMNKAVKM